MKLLYIIDNYKTVKMTYEYTGLSVQITSTEKSKDRNFYAC